MLRSFSDEVGAIIKKISGYEIQNERKTMYLGNVTVNDIYIVKILLTRNKEFSQAHSWRSVTNWCYHDNFIS